MVKLPNATILFPSFFNLKIHCIIPRHNSPGIYENLTHISCDLKLFLVGVEAAIKVIKHLPSNKKDGI